MSYPSVLAAIPNYNMGELLGASLRPLLEQEYNGVVVLDDGSTDSSRDVIAPYGDDVELVEGQRNLGAGANRNRILESRTLSELKRFGSVLIHFVDADTIVTSERTPEQIREAMQTPNIGVAGGLVLNEDGSQHWLNYGLNMCGPLRCLTSYGAALFASKIQKAYESGGYEAALRARSRYGRLAAGYPDITDQDLEAKRVGWVIEANMVIDSNVFAAVGGFDPKLRFHEIQDLSRKLELGRLFCYFKPGIVATRTDRVDVRGKRRNYEDLSAAVRLIARYSRPSNRVSKPIELSNPVLQHGEEEETL